MTNPFKKEKMLTVQQVSTRLNCGKSVVYNLIQTGRLPAIKLAPITIRIKEGDFDRLLEEMKIKSIVIL